MDKIIAHQRLRQAVEYLKDKGTARRQADMAALMGVPQPHIAAALKGDERRLTEGFLRRFAAAYSDYINEDWLLTGEGEMTVPDKSLRPHIGVLVAAGFMTGIGENDKGDDLCEKIPFLSDYDFTITAYGQSMTPEIEDGDILACRIAQDRANPPIGKICVIDSKEGAVVKIIKGASNSEIMLHSINPDYKDYSIELSSLNRIAVVVGIIKKLI